MTIRASAKKAPSTASRIRHLDRDGRLVSPGNGAAWRVVAADRGRVDPAVEYLFCAPDFLFPVVDTNARALRLELEH
jgi:hypothetical protein